MQKCTPFVFAHFLLGLCREARVWNRIFHVRINMKRRMMVYSSSVPLHYWPLARNPWWNSGSWTHDWNNHWDSPFPNMLSRHQASQIALRRIPGHVLEIETNTVAGRLAYDVHIRSHQHIYKVSVCAHTGQILNIELYD